MQESRMYSFLDSKNGFTLHFLEGQKLIYDLVLTHSLNKDALSYYRDTVLTSQQMLNFLKTGETLGFYIDSEEPYFRFKIEMNANGHMRTLLLPESFEQFPKELNGVFRITKIFPNARPYNSVTKMNHIPTKELVNQALSESYQTNSTVLLSDDGDQSLMLTKMPPIDIKKQVIEEDLTLSEYKLKIKQFINELFKSCPDDIESIVNTFEKNDFAYLGSKEVQFNCSCSQERMEKNLLSLHHNDLDEVFQEDKSIEVRCDYCNTVYVVEREKLGN
jgi:molecular chaperone Hsp33